MRKVAGARVKEGTNCIQITNIEKIITSHVRTHVRKERKEKNKYNHFRSHKNKQFQTTERKRKKKEREMVFGLEPIGQCSNM